MAYSDSPSDILSRLRAIELELQDLRRRSTARALTIQDGTIQLRGSSRLEAVQPDDAPQDLKLRLGNLGYTWSGGEPQQGLEVRYDKGAGAQAILVGRPGLNVDSTTTRQYVALCDTNGRIIVSSDAASGLGMARPYLHVPLRRVDVASGLGAGVGSSQSASYAGVYEAFTPQQHPVLQVRWYILSSGGTTGRLGLKINGTLVAELITPAAGASTAQYILVAPNVGFDSIIQIGIEMRRDSGLGTIYGDADIWWRQS